VKFNLVLLSGGAAQLRGNIGVNSPTPLVIAILTGHSPDFIGFPRVMFGRGNWTNASFGWLVLKMAAYFKSSTHDQHS
jgi:hypothetical protein